MTYSNMDNVPTQTAGTSELLASDWNTYVRDNFDAIKFGHIVCTSSTRPTGIAEGAMIYETDTNKALIYNGSSWVEIHDLDNTGGLPTALDGLNSLLGAGTSFTPSWTNLGGTFAYNNGKYWQVGKQVTVRTFTKFGAGTTYSGEVQLATPTSYVGSDFWTGDGYPNYLMPHGMATLNDASAGVNARYSFFIFTVRNDNFLLNFYSTAGNAALTNSSPVTLANQDSISTHFTYFTP